jgi:hypothetical protein
MSKYLVLAASLLLLAGSVAGAAPTAPPVPSVARGKIHDTGEATSVAIGDLNRDRKPDLVTANTTVSVLLNRGDGSFRPKRNYAAGRDSMSLAIGDLNSDGVPDLATANANKVSVLLNPGDARFRVRREYSTGHSPASVAIGDLNGDGKPEPLTPMADVFR